MKTMNDLAAEAEAYLLEVDADLRISAGQLFGLRETADLITNRVYRDAPALEMLVDGEGTPTWDEAYATHIGRYLA